MRDLIARAERAGTYFFSPDAMRFFSSRISESSLTRIDADTYRFVTSERNVTAPRLYTVREIRFTRETREDGRTVERCHIDSVAGGFQAYASLSTARRHILDGAR